MTIKAGQVYYTDTQYFVIDKVSSLTGCKIVRYRFRMKDGRFIEATAELEFMKFMLKCGGFKLLGEVEWD